MTCDRSVVFSIQHYVIKFVSDLWQVSGFLYTTLCDKVCQWLAAGRWFSLYNIMWSSLSVTCDRPVVFSIQHYVIKFVSDLWQVSGFLYTTLCDQVCQWLVTGQWFSLYNIMWSSLSVTCDRSVVFSIQHYVIKFVSDLWQVSGFLYTTLCDQVCQWLVTGQWFSLYNIMWSSLSVTCDRSVVFSIQHYVIKFVSDLWQVGGFLYTTLCDQVCQWLVTSQWFSLYNIMWSSLSVTCDRSVVFSIQHYVIKFVSDLWQVSGFLYTTLCDKVCQWLAAGRWFSLYNIMWSSLSVTCDRPVVFSIQHYVIKFVSDLWQVSGFLYTTLCDQVCQWLVTGQWFSLYNIMWSSLSVTCDRSVVFSIQHYVIKFVSDLWQVSGFLYTTLCDQVCQWLVTGQWFSLYNIMWSSLSVTCDRSVVFSIQHYVIKLVSDLWQVGGFLYTTLCDQVCQWLVTSQWFSLYNIMWSSLSVTCDRLVVFSIQHYVIKFVSDLWQVGSFLYTTLCDQVCQWLVTGW